MSEKQTIEAGNSLPQPLCSTWWINGWTRASRVAAALACYPRLATERIACRIFRAKKREAQLSNPTGQARPQAKEQA